MAGDPSHIGSTPPDIAVLDVEDPGQGLGGSDTVAAMDMLDTLGLAGSSGGIEDEQPVLSIHLLALAYIGLLFHQLVIPDILSCLHGHIDACSLDHYYILHAGCVSGGLIHIGLEGEGFAAPEEAVCGDYYL